MSRQTTPVGLTAIILLALTLAACGVRGALVPPDTGDVLIETSDSRAPRAPGSQTPQSTDNDDTRFPAPEAVK